MWDMNPWVGYVCMCESRTERVRVPRSGHPDRNHPHPRLNLYPNREALPPPPTPCSEVLSGVGGRGSRVETDPKVGEGRGLEMGV